MKNAKDPSIQEGMIQVVIGISIIHKEEYVTVGGTWVDNVLCPSDIICGVIESCQMMVINAVVLEKY